MTQAANAVVLSINGKAADFDTLTDLRWWLIRIVDSQAVAGLDERAAAAAHAAALQELIVEAQEVVDSVDGVDPPALWVTV